MARFRVHRIDWFATRPDDAIERQVLAPLGAELIVPASPFDRIEEADAVLHLRTPLDERVIAGMRRCRIIAHYGVGVDRIDVDAASRRGIYVTNCPTYCVPEVSDHTLALLLACARRLREAEAGVAAGEWGMSLIQPLRRLAGATLGLIGFGRIARAVALKARAFGVHITACDPYLAERLFASAGAARAPFDAVLQGSDFVSVHVPLTPETTHLMNEAAFRQMRSSAYLINTSRGRIVDGRALLASLQEGRLAGAALDVLEEEPPRPDDPLLHHPRVLVTGHTAYYSEESIAAMQREAAEQVAMAFRGEAPSAAVNLEAVRGARRDS